ncbi:MAG: SDR family NAD(P)-dependent oxidoreductase, partial [Anaerolineae bacterium]|nr:SDR family NAD(P)-dependent oxidoreductase [Anaerolineae bacterium]
MLTHSLHETYDNAVAIIGMAGRFPGAQNLDQFWQNLRDGVASTTFFSDEELVAMGVDPALVGHPNFVKAGAVLDNIDRFDAQFFGIIPQEAELIDPQHRLFLECAWEAFEYAGINPTTYPGPVGVYAGTRVSNYEQHYITPQADPTDPLYWLQTYLGNDKDQLPTRVSYKLNLTGPSVTVQTACSTSLVAVHTACQALLNGECDLALAGGVSIRLPQAGYFYQEGMIFSPDGYCRTFDASGQGSIFGNGLGVVLLKRLDEALSDGDPIAAVIRGSAVNHDGAFKVGYTAPSEEGQARVIGEALAVAQIAPETISYIEAHGTATPLGDPIEVAALSRVFSATPRQSCAIGSVKTNVGHLEVAAGIAGLIKTVLALKHQQIPPSLHFATPNPEINFGETPFSVNTTLTDWPGARTPRRAGVSSFGMGGTNAHVVLEEAPALKAASASVPQPYLFVLSARSEERLKVYVEKMLAFLDKEADVSLAQMAYTLQVGRVAMAYRLAFVVTDSSALRGKLATYLAGKASLEQGYQGQVQPDKATADSISDDDDSRSLIRQWLAEGRLEKLAERWVTGLEIEWDLLYQAAKPDRIPLPTYPFTPERHWIANNEQYPEGTSLVMNNEQSFSSRILHPSSFQLHPLVHRNTSTLTEQRFSTTFSGAEFFLTDHQVQGEKVLPGVAYLEMARAAGTMAIENEPITQIKDVVWLRPLLVKAEPVETRLGLYPDARGEIAFEVSSGETVYSQGKLVVGEISPPEPLDIPAIEARCRSSMEGADCYRRFGDQRLNYGPAFQTIEKLSYNEREVLARLRLPAGVEQARYGLHPSLLDGALQAMIGLVVNQTDQKHQSPWLPFAVQTVDIYKGVPVNGYAYVRYSDEVESGGNVIKYDITLTDDQAAVCVTLKGLTIRAIAEPSQPDVFYSTPGWQGEPLAEDEAATEVEPAAKTLLLIGLERGLGEAISASFDQTEVIELAPAKGTDLVQQSWPHLQALVKSSPANPYQMLIVMADTVASYWSGTLAGLLKTAQLEQPHLRGKVITVTEPDSGRLLPLLRREMKADSFEAVEVRYDAAGTRTNKTLREIEVSRQETASYLKSGGVYWITGGLGALGRLFARHLLDRGENITVILSGRSALDEAGTQHLADLNQRGGTVTYLPVDVSLKAEVERAVQTITEQYGPLNGIIHSAGVIRDSLIVNKTAAEIEAVLAPKVSGTLNIDAVTQAEPLDFVVLFSSIVGVLGNIGQVDYAAANAFLDGFAHHRQTLVEEGKRSGRTLSINWPLWAEGGMVVHDETIAWLTDEMGLTALETSAGLATFEAGLAQQKMTQLLVTSGDRRKIRAYLRRMGQTRAKAEDQRVDLTAVQKGHLVQAAETYLKGRLAEILKLPVARIDPNDPWEKYGIDSIMILNMTRQLEQQFGELPKTLFFEYQTLTALTGYFVKTYPIQLQKILELAPDKAEPKPDVSLTAAPDIAISSTRRRWLDRGRQNAAAGETETIAIVGLSGRYPQAESLAEFWENLKAGRDCITEIPAERWDWRRYAEAEPDQLPNKWGGFMADVDKFDPLFFNISPREAERMDPQERLFLEIAWQTLEDAGYTRQTLTQQLQGRMGVFVGVMWGEYQLYGQGQVSVSSSYASIANRVSYYLNLHGPSLAVDTMCSSSLTSIHLACESLKRGECLAALAGGVNVTIHPNKYIQLTQGNFAASDGRCRSFGEGGDGYVPGEGVGAVLLKPLSQAEADGDHIYGVIKGSSINHGGKTNGYTVPNPVAQRQLIADTMHRSGVRPESISYVEAHGTGTALGDPIEISGLSQAFGEGLPDAYRCAIGSVKSNIGHLEAAAGIAGLTKVLLQMKHRQLAPSLHSETLNPHIDFEATPFWVQRALTDWQRPVIEVEGVRTQYARRAGLSSFGAGGANAHLIVEEYLELGIRNDELRINNEPLGSREQGIGEGPQVIVLSAKTEERLRVYAAKLLAFLEGGSMPKPADQALDLSVIEPMVGAMVVEIMGVDPTDIESEHPFESYGLDPVQLSLLKIKVEELYHCDLPPTLFSGQGSAGSIVQYLASLTILDGQGEPPVATESTLSLASIAYTLQVGREAMDNRLAIVTEDIITLRKKLTAYLVSETNVEGLHWGSAKKEHKKTSIFAQDEDLQEALNKWIRKGKLGKLAELWVSGVEIDWTLLYSRQRPKRISLPTYPFERKRYWVDEHQNRQQPRSASSLPANQSQNQQSPGKLELKLTQAVGKPLIEAQDTNEPSLPKITQTDLRLKNSSIDETRSHRVSPVNEASGLSLFDARKQVRNLLKSTLYLEGAVDEDKSFNELGMDSITGVEFVKALNRSFSVEMKVAKLYDYPTVEALSAYLTSLVSEQTPPPYHDMEVGDATSTKPITDPSPSGKLKLPTLAHNQAEPPIEEARSETDVPSDIQERDVAVIGMAGRFPGAGNLDAFWHNLREGVCSITEIPPDRWDVSRFFDPNPNAPAKSSSKWGGFLTDIDKFDPLFFNISPAEAEMMDPQQRLVLEEAYHALEAAGYGSPSATRRGCGLYVGLMSGNEYLSRLAQTKPAQAMMGNAGSILAGRVAYAFDLQGPVVTVDTACSSSLVAVDMACKSLLNREAEMMLAGGVTLYLTEQPYLGMSKAGMLSPDGLCKTFDSRADGFVPGEGVGFVVLKRLSQAIADGDTIYGVIKGSGVNQDGKTNGLTAPNVKSQRELQLAVYRKYGIDPSEITYVEAHGTGTKLGDPIEVEALSEAFQTYTKTKQYCALGSVKSNIGHTSAAAGVAGLLKVLLALKHRQIPPSLHFEQPNEHIDFESSPFYVNTELKDWTVESGLRRAAVSSFGFSGTNAHLVIEEYQGSGDRGQKSEAGPQVIVLSARNEERLKAYAEKLLTFLEADLDVSLTDLAYTLQIGREAMDNRLAFVVTDLSILRDKLTAYLADETVVIEQCYQGQVKQEQDSLNLLNNDDDSQSLIRQWLVKGKLEKLAQLWVSGVEIEWTLLYPNQPPRRISLPTYPFAKKRYWFDGQGMKEKQRSQAVAATSSRAYEAEPTQLVRPHITGQQKVRLADLAAQPLPGNEEKRQAVPEPAAVYDPIEAADQLVTETAQVVSIAASNRPSTTPVQNRQAIEQQLRQQLVDLLYVEPEEVEADKKFIDLGLDSITGVEWVKRINAEFGLNLSATTLYDHPTLPRLANHLVSLMPEHSREPSAAKQDLGAVVLANRESIRLKPTGEQPEPIKTRIFEGYGLVVSSVQAVADSRLTAWSVSPPKDDEVQIEVKASAINFPDVLCLKGLYPTLPSYPFVPGFEVAGVVTAVGQAVSHLAAGDAVIAVTGRQLGGHAHFVNVPGFGVVKKPDSLSFEAACSLPIIFLTTYHAFELAKLKVGEHTLIQTAAGGCGLMAVQLANLQQAIIYGTSSRESKLAFLEQIGVDYPLDYTGPFDERIKSLTANRGVDVVLNMLAGPAIQKGLKVLAPGGRYLELAVHGLRASGELDLSHLVHNQAFYSIDGRRGGFGGPELMTRYLKRMVEMVVNEEIYPVVHKIYPLSQIQQALHYVESGAHLGKVVISHSQEQVIDLTEQCLRDMVRQKQRSRRRKPVQVQATEKQIAASQPNDDIAIIGMAGRFPGAEDVQQFWSNLATGIDSIREVAPERWDIERYYDPDRQAPGKSSSKWLGAMADIDKFDPLFFNISPREAELMDPQQRLFLEEAWTALEDAGYAGQTLSECKCGIFVGVGVGDYHFGLDRSTAGVDAHTLLGSAPSILTARLAYILNLKGPCLAIDTACSSSLVAIHEGCQSLLTGQNDMVLAGGVSVLTGPQMHIMTSQAGMLAGDGRCKTFDNRADGFGIAEGVGVVVLKRLAEAERDGDQIYGVIKGSGLNQDGATNGITAPSVTSQTALELEVYRRSGIDPSSITLVEAHGTGTKLGDPIEVEALTKAFRSYTEQSGYCALGSVKMNIGHTLTAAGVAGVIKVLLALKHQQLPPSLHFEQPNEHIDFETSPFYVNTELKAWEVETGPRRAAVSSFGFSGTNAHLVIEEYQGARVRNQGAGEGPQVIVLSARNEERLRAYAQRLLAFLEQASAPQLADQKRDTSAIEQTVRAMVAEMAGVSPDEIEVEQPFEAYGLDVVQLSWLKTRVEAQYGCDLPLTLLSEQASVTTVTHHLASLAAQDKRNPQGEASQLGLSLASLAYTLQVGREAMEMRLALVAHNLADVQHKLADYLENKTENIFQHYLQADSARLDLLMEGNEAKVFVKSLIKEGRLEKLAQLWVSGIEIEWGLLHGVEKPDRISLPTYPFARERYWLPNNEELRMKNEELSIHNPQFTIASLHPLVHKNISDLEEQRFSTVFRGSEFFLTDHRVRGEKVLPGVAYLEMARAAGTMAVREGAVIQLKDVVWLRPLVVGDAPVETQVGLYAEESGEVRYEVSTLDDEGNPLLHSRGQLVMGAAEESQTIDLAAIRQRCLERVTGETCYRRFEEHGLVYGPSFQVIEDVVGNETEALARLRLPAEVDTARYTLPPSLLDGALQSVMGLTGAQNLGLSLPFALDLLELLAPLPATGYAYVTRLAVEAETAHFNVALLDDQGRVCLKLHNFTVKAIPQPEEPGWYYHPYWQREELAAAQSKTAQAMGDIVLIFPKGLEPLADRLMTHYPQQRVVCFTLSNTNMRLSETEWEVDLNDSEGMTASLDTLTRIDTLYFLGGLSEQHHGPFSLDGLARSQEQGVLNLFRLVKILEQRGLMSHLSNLKVLTNHAQQLHSQEPIQPWSASLSGLTMSLAREYPAVKVSCIDVILTPNEAGQPILAEANVLALIAEGGGQGQPVALRQGVRYIRQLAPLSLPPAQEPLYRPSGVYLILGGAGGIGLETAVHLAEQVQAKVVLVGRSALTSEKQAQLERIRDAGGDYLYCRADGADLSQMQAVVREANETFGPINGVIHSALVLRDGSLRTTTEADFHAALTPKVTGSVVLAEVVKDEPLDFMLFFSSVQSMWGNAGQGNYAAGSTFADAYALYLN